MVKKAAATPKRQIRLQYGLRTDKATDQKAGFITASTTIGNKQISKQGPTETEALSELRRAVESYEKIAAEKETYPRTIEVDW